MTRSSIRNSLKVIRRDVGLLWNLPKIRTALALAEGAHSVLAMGTDHLSPDAARAVTEIHDRLTAFRDEAEALDGVL